ncbi:MAG: NUMOD4 motif-containing HNH endonuclease [Acidiferrobacterales bacterium]
MIEEWRPVFGYEGVYEVSSEGRVRRVAPGKGTWTGPKHPPGRHNHGYRMFVLTLRGIQRSYLAHRLVAEAFIGPCPVGQEVNHKDGDKANNRHANLEYLTQSGNTQHALAMGLMRHGERHYAAILTAVQVVEIRAEWKRGQASLTTLAARFGVSRGAINGIVFGKNWKRVGESVARYG